METILLFEPSEGRYLEVPKKYVHVNDGFGFGGTLSEKSGVSSKDTNSNIAEQAKEEKQDG